MTDRREIRTGVHLPNHGPASRALDLADCAQAVERAGFDSVWLSDHVVLVDGATSRYPFCDDGRFFLPADEDWLEWSVTAAYVAAHTTSVSIGVGVCVLPLRHPLLLAKQAATLDRLSKGRLILGVGAGWLAEEFEALGQDFAGRGRAMDGGLSLLRDAWKDDVVPGRYGPYGVGAGIHVRPTPIGERVPILVGGSSPAALRRVVQYGDGWYGTSVGGDIDPAELAAIVDALRHRCADAGRDLAELDIALRIAAPRRAVPTRSFRERLGEHLAAGVTRLSFDIGWRSIDEAQERLEELQSSVDDALDLLD